MTINCGKSIGHIIMKFETEIVKSASNKVY